MKVVLQPGEEIEVMFAGTSGEIKVAFHEEAIQVKADIPDDNGRSGLIYEERFDEPKKLPPEKVPFALDWRNQDMDDPLR